MTVSADQRASSVFSIKNWKGEVKNSSCVCLKRIPSNPFFKCIHLAELHIMLYEGSVTQIEA